MVRQVNSVSINQPSHFLLCEVSSLVEGDTTCDTMVMSKAFCSSMNDCVGRNTVSKKEKSTYILNIIETHLMPSRFKRSDILRQPPGGHLVSLRNIVILWLLISVLWW